MAVISNANLQMWLDKITRWATESVGDPEFNNAFTAGMSTANGHVFSGAGALDTAISIIADIDVVADLLPTARDLDESNPTPPTGFLIAVPGVQAAIAAMNKHVVRYGAAANLDAYLTALNLVTPTLRAHGHFKKYLGTISAKNSFVPNDTILATFAATGATTGTYAHVASIAVASYSGAKLVVKNNGAVTTGATLTVTGKKLDNTTASLTATIGTGTDAFETNLSVTTKSFIDVTAITITGGTNANQYKIVAKTDRDISAA